MEAVGTASAELGVAQVRDAAEHRGDPAPRPSDRVLDRRERPRLVRAPRERSEQLAHQVAAAVVEADDLARSAMAFSGACSDPRTARRFARLEVCRAYRRSDGGCLALAGVDRGHDLGEDRLGAVVVDLAGAGRLVAAASVGEHQPADVEGR